MTYDLTKGKVNKVLLKFTIPLFISVIFQQMYMVNNLNVFDNIILPAYQSERKDRTKAEINDYARELMKKLSISEIAGNDINEVSGGQLQRACICRLLSYRIKGITLIMTVLRPFA